MAEKIQPKPTDKPLADDTALRSSEITRLDLIRARQKWSARDPLFFRKIAMTAMGVNDAKQ